jgi:hypothetical protein
LTGLSSEDVHWLQLALVYLSFFLSTGSSISSVIDQYMLLLVLPDFLIVGKTIHESIFGSLDADTWWW